MYPASVCVYIINSKTTLGFYISSKLNNNAHAFAVRLVPKICNSINSFNLCAVLQFFTISLALLTRYGSSVTTIRFFTVIHRLNICHSAYTDFTTAVRYASLIPAVPEITPPVGKSGPLMMLINSSMSVSFLLNIVVN